MKAKRVDGNGLQTEQRLSVTPKPIDTARESVLSEDEGGRRRERRGDGGIRSMVRDPPGRWPWRMTRFVFNCCGSRLRVNSTYLLLQPTGFHLIYLVYRTVYMSLPASHITATRVEGAKRAYRWHRANNRYQQQERVVKAFRSRPRYFAELHESHDCVQ